MKKLTLKAEKRKIFGRKVKKLRQEEILPANLYGKKVKSLALQLNLKDFLAVWSQAGETNIIELAITKEEKIHSVLIHNLQIHPVSDAPLHVDFREIDLKEKVQVVIPIELSGEAPAVNKGGVLVLLLKEIQVEALPTDLPEKFVVDVAKLAEIGQSLSVKDLQYDKAKIELLVEDENLLVVKIEEPAKEEVEEKPAEVAPLEGEAVEEAGKEGEAEKEGKEGAKPAEAKPTEAKPKEEKETPKKEEKK